ncbi:class I SAM-dependent methyltransferase [Sphingomonas daechungensis]
MSVVSQIQACRLCGSAVSGTALSLGDQPISNRLPLQGDGDGTAPVYPLNIVVCTSCGLPQLEHNLAAEEHFHDDYTYVSGASSTWVEHCRDYAGQLVRDFGLGPGDLVVEAGSNDGTLLRFFAEAGVRVLGVEPSGNVAEIARASGIPTLTAFFNEETARNIVESQGRPKLFIGNNVLAHVPDTDGFLQAARDLITHDGALCFEFPHFTRILTHRYFDTIYHEHYCYLGVGPLSAWAKTHGMVVADVQPQSTHGGSLRLFLEKQGRPVGEAAQGRIDRYLAEESELAGAAPWQQLEHWLGDWRSRFRGTVSELRSAGKTVAAYAAASKATVLSNYLGLTANDVEWCCDASPLKQGRLIPGANIPIVVPATLRDDPPDAIIAFAWNIFDEIADVVAANVVQETLLIRPLPEIETRTVGGGAQ